MRCKRLSRAGFVVNSCCVLLGRPRLVPIDLTSCRCSCRTFRSGSRRGTWRITSANWSILGSRIAFSGAASPPGPPRFGAPVHGAVDGAVVGNCPHRGGAPRPPLVVRQATPTFTRPRLAASPHLLCRTLLERSVSGLYSNYLKFIVLIRDISYTKNNLRTIPRSRHALRHGSSHAHRGHPPPHLRCIGRTPPPARPVSRHRTDRAAELAVRRSGDGGRRAAPCQERVLGPPRLQPTRPMIGSLMAGGQTCAPKTSPRRLTSIPSAGPATTPARP